jgi:hypothetical protein
MCGVPAKAGGIKRDIQLSAHRNFIVIGIVVSVKMYYSNGVESF